MTETVLEFCDVTKAYRGRSGLLGRGDDTTALRHVSLAVEDRTVVALVGESGAGKSTAGRIALGLEQPDGGQVLFEGRDLTTLNRRQRRGVRRHTHFILQDPYQSLHPAMTVAKLVAEPLTITKTPRPRREERVMQALDEVSLTPPGDYAARYPHELSGGQRQRVAFARAMVAEPRLVVADEPVSMLDVSLQAGILELVARLSTRHAVIFITHDLAVARHVADRIVVMYAGRVIETGPADDVVYHPHHPYTTALLGAAEHLSAPPADPGPFPPGGRPCQQYGHCDPRSAACREAEPVLLDVRPGHQCAWHVAEAAPRPGP